MDHKSTKTLLKLIKKHLLWWRNQRSRTIHFLINSGANKFSKSEPNLLLLRSHRRSSDFCERQCDYYEIGDDVELFLTKASMEKPANVPMVVAMPSTLYQTGKRAVQLETFLPLGIVVNAVFKLQHWLYVQTPHAEEGYINYSACLPLGIIQRPHLITFNNDMNATGQVPCWENNTDIFPAPMATGNYV